MGMRSKHDTRDTPRARTLRLFPLAQVVLFPETQVPLYVFEPRYREMTRDALEGDRWIGMIAVQPRHAADMSGDPPLFEIGCAGRIERAQSRPDGTYGILLTATQRFRVLDELPRRHAYRVAQVEVLEEATGDADEASIHPRRREIQDALARLVALRQRELESDAPVPLAQLEALDDDRYVNVLAQTLDFGVLERQRLLEAHGTANRYDVMSDLMRFRLAEMGLGAGPSTDAVH
jgi:Lon protease-like protein